MQDFLIALYYVAADYHSGQWSRGYSTLCMAAMYLRREFDYSVSLDDELTAQQQRLYFQLAEKYGERL